MVNDEVRNSRFRYVDADDLEHASVDFSDLDVRNPAGEKLGGVDGFIVDAVSDRPYYVVVNSGGWFSGGKYLVPINHARLEHDTGEDEDVLRVNLDKDTIRKYPTFDKDEFARLSDDPLHEFERRIGQACCPGQAAAVEGTWNYERWEHYREPDWWRPATRRPRGARTDDLRPQGAPRVPAGPRETHPRTRGLHDPERIVAFDSQPVGSRAEPGDVLGIESGGEETHLGDTAEDEERRVQISDRDARRAEKNNRG